MTNEKKRCRVCAEPREENDLAKFMCSGCHDGLSLDIARVKAVPRRFVRAVKAFWQAAVQP